MTRHLLILSLILALASVLHAQETSTDADPKAAARDAAVDKTLAALDKAWEKVTSYTSTNTTRSKTSWAENQTYEHVSTGETIFKAEADKLLWRSTTEMTETTTTDGQAEVQKTSTLSVSDGTATWTETTDAAGAVSAMKSAPMKKGAWKPSFAMTLQRSYNTVTQVADQEIGGYTCNVFEVRAKAVPGITPGKDYSTNAYDAKTGILVKTTLYDANSKVTMEMTMSDIELGASVDASQFKYTPPEGVAVVDIEAQMKAMREMQEKMQKEAGQAGQAGQD